MTFLRYHPTPVTAARPAVAAHRSAAATIAFACAAMLVSYLPFSAINGVLGTIGAATHSGTAGLQWATDAFTVALTGAVLTGGALAECYGRRLVTVAGLALTLVGSLTGWASGASGGSIHLLWAAQAVSGAGAGLVMSATLALIGATATSPAVRTRAIAFWAACNVVGLGGGPFLAAAATRAAGWSWLFPPICLLAAATGTFGLLCAREVRATAVPAATTDRRGQLLGTAAVVVVVFAVIHGGGPAGWAAPATLGGLAASAALVAAFLLVERRAVRPVLAPALFTSRGFTAAGLASATALFTVIGVVFVASLYLAGRGVDDLGIAERLGCLFAGNALASVVAGPLQNRAGSQAVLLGGLLTGAAGLAALTTLPGPGVGELGWRLALLGAGCGTAVASSTAVAVQSVPGPRAAMAGTANNVIRQLGGALGTAVIGAVYAGHLAAGGTPLAATHASVTVLLVVLAASTAASAALLVTRHRR